MDATVRRWTGVSGIATVVIQVAAVGLFLPAGLPPSLSDAGKLVSYLSKSEALLVTGVIVFFFAFAVELVFISGLRSIFASGGPANEWLATTVFGFGIASLIIAFVGVGMTTAAVAEAAGQAEPASVRTLYELSLILGGAPSLVVSAFFLGAAGSASIRSGVLPRWVAWLAWAASILVLLAVPSAYGGNDPLAFYSADGFATILALLPLYVWIIATSVAILRARRP